MHQQCRSLFRFKMTQHERDRLRMFSLEQSRKLLWIRLLQRLCTTGVKLIGSHHPALHVLGAGPPERLNEETRCSSCSSLGQKLSRGGHLMVLVQNLL